MAGKGRRGASLVAALGKTVEGLTEFPNWSSAGVDIPSSPAALWVWLRGDDLGDTLRRAHTLGNAIGDDFSLIVSIDGFRHGEGRDLTGYIDGTENPEGNDAIETAFIAEGELAGSSFVAVQKWVHNLHTFNAMPADQRDHTIGRRISDNEEIDDAPESAHVKRTAQESFSPEAFLLRRSMPWADVCTQGLMFVAFAASVAPFEAQLQRMIGMEDGIVDALFDFSRPVSGSYFWCPPMHRGELDLGHLGL